MVAPAEVREYLERLVERLVATLGDRVIGVHYQSGRSDIDVYAHIRRAQTEAVVWYAGRAMLEESAIAACRGWHWQKTGTFASKRQALSWAATKAADEGAPSQL